MGKYQKKNRKEGVETCKTSFLDPTKSKGAEDHH